VDHAAAAVEWLADPIERIRDGPGISREGVHEAPGSDHRRSTRWWAVAHATWTDCPHLEGVFHDFGAVIHDGGHRTAAQSA